MRRSEASGEPNPRNRLCLYQRYLRYTDSFADDKAQTGTVPEKSAGSGEKSVVSLAIIIVAYERNTSDGIADFVRGVSVVPHGGLNASPEEACSRKSPSATD